MKVLHVPTMKDVICEIRGSYDALEENMQALLLAISFAAIMSLSEFEVGSHSGYEVEFPANHQPRSNKTSILEETNSLLVIRKAQN